MAIDAIVTASVQTWRNTAMVSTMDGLLEYS